MPRDRLAVVLRPRSEVCRATTRVLEGTNFECRFLYPERKTQPQSLSDTIASQFGLEWSSYRVVVADVEFMFSRYHGEDSYRLDEISRFTNPELWTRAETSASPKAAGDAFFEFVVAGEKRETISLQAELEIACDPEKRLVAFDFAPSEPEASWARIADGVLVSQTQAGGLKSILFEDVVSHQQSE
jgi:hypothetical protein